MACIVDHSVFTIGFSDSFVSREPCILQELARDFI